MNDLSLDFDLYDDHHEWMDYDFQDDGDYHGQCGFPMYLEPHDDHGDGQMNGCYLQIVLS